MRCARTDSLPRRPAFTMVELLVVVAIIVVIAGLLSAAVFYTIGGQQSRNTEATVRTAYKVLTEQWSYVVNQAKKETPSPVVKAMAQVSDGDPTGARARVLWTKVRLMEAFPITYAEVNNNAKGTDPVCVFLYGSASQAPAIPLGQQKYRTAYQRNLGSGTLYQDNTGTSATESAACLLMALSVSRGGSSLSADQLGKFVADSDQDGVNEIVDGFGNALAFYRFAWGTAPLPGGANGGIQGLNPAAIGSRNFALADPLDPNGLLLTWASGKGTPRATFHALAHPIALAGSTTNTWYVIPVIVSAGPDGQLGLPLPYQLPGTASANPPGLAAQNLTTRDDVFSFNLTGN